MATARAINSMRTTLKMMFHGLWLRAMDRTRSASVQAQYVIETTMLVSAQ